MNISKRKAHRKKRTNGIIIIDNGSEITNQKDILNEQMRFIYITHVDFEKEFYSIEWPFLLETLKKFNFGEQFISWIKIIYNHSSACVGNNVFFQCSLNDLDP